MNPCKPRLNAATRAGISSCCVAGRIARVGPFDGRRSPEPADLDDAGSPAKPAKSPRRRKGSKPAKSTFTPGGRRFHSTDIAATLRRTRFRAQKYAWVAGRPQECSWLSALRRLGIAFPHHAKNRGRKRNAGSAQSAPSYGLRGDFASPATRFLGLDRLQSRNLDRLGGHGCCASRGLVHAGGKGPAR